MEYRVVARRTSMRSLLGGVLLQSEVATGQAPDAATGAFVSNILSSVQGSLYAGDALGIVRNVQGDTIAYLNGQELARAHDRTVADYLLLGWIGERGPPTAFRDAILGGSIDPGLLTILEHSHYSSEREAQVASWLQPPLEQSLDSVEQAENQRETQAAAASAMSIELPEVAATLPAVTDLSGTPTPENPVQVASLVPTAELLPGIEEPASQALDITEYSQRVANFHKQLVAMVYGEIRYPKRAVRRELQGRLELDITLGDNGNLVDVAVVQSSGHSILDKAAVAAAEEAFEDNRFENIDPFAASEFSSEETEGQLVVPVPITFLLTQ